LSEAASTAAAVTTAAFFDLDHTLLTGTTTERLFLRRLLRSGELGPAELVRYLAQFRREPRLTGGFFRRNKAYLAGKPLSRILPLAEEAARQALSLMSPRGKQVLAEHHAAGRLVVLVTGTLDILAEPLRRELPIDVVIASNLVRADGRLTGGLSGLYPRGENKRALVRRLAEERGIDLARSFAYGDDWTDVPMLESVGHPVAVNPSQRLRELAERKGWAIERF
jgi:HAD superfamily hydrolase (TIGR01490 family)